MSDNKPLSLDQFAARLGNDVPGFAHALRSERANQAFCSRIRGDLKQLRQEMDVTQKDLADRLETSQSAVSKMESGEGDIGLMTVFRYAEALGMQPTVAFSPAASTYLRQAEITKAVNAMERLTQHKNSTADRHLHQQIRTSLSHLKTMDALSSAIPSTLVSLLISEMTETVAQSISTRMAALLSAASVSIDDILPSTESGQIEAIEEIIQPLPDRGHAVADR